MPTTKAPGPSPELLMPAGGFESAIAAVEGGTDALYLGFADFSARKQARNFDRLEYRRLHKLARDRGLRLYVTINTVVYQGELAGVAELLAFLGRFPPDAVLVQDWGLAALIRERYPAIAIHASTQAAVQGAAAARLARELGATRIVLPRETSLAQMRALRDAEPGLEYEAFVHGALCYSFSGLCLASGLVLGRSGNRGECAQLCRSYYDAEGARSRGYWFSCRDLDLSRRLRELTEAGISSLKVEGRMKSPEYCYAVARLYRGRLDELAGLGPGEEELRAREEAAAIAFSRSPTEAWLYERGGSRLIDSAYPGHRGLGLGRVLKSSGSSLTIKLDRPLGLRDGILGFEGQGPAAGASPLDESRPARFPARGLRDPRSGRELYKAEAGTTVEIEARLEEGRAPSFGPGSGLRLISSREMDRKAPSPEEYEAARESLELELEIAPEGLSAELALPAFGGPGSVGAARIEAGQAISLDEARQKGGLARALAVFSESGEADFRLSPRIRAGASVALPSGKLAEALDLFIPPSTLKREKNRIYERASSLVAEAQAAYARESLALCESVAQRAASERHLEAPPRGILTFAREGLPSGMPFATLRDLAAGASLPSWGGRSWLPLAPLADDRRGYEALVSARVAQELSRGASLVIGLGALHHIALGRELASAQAEAGERLGFFIDFNLYVANDLAYASLSSLLPGIEFAYRYLESAPEAIEESGLPIFPLGVGFSPPLFQSLGCFKKHDARDGSCDPGCDKLYSTRLSDRERKYLVLVEDCVTYMFGIPAERGTP